MISILTWLLALISVTQASNCFDNNGQIRPEMTPCNASAQISACCITSSYCLSNGLCLNSASNNLLSVHGCTDSNWGSPCSPYCHTEGGAYYASNLFPCPIALANNDPSTTPSYCCGPDPRSCCQNGNNFTVPVGTIVLRPGDPGIPTSSSSYSSSSTTPPNTPTSLPISSTSSMTPQTSAAITPAASTDSKVLAIGLGVGIPMGLALIGTIVWFTLELRRYNGRLLAARGDTNMRIKHPQPEQRFLWGGIGTYELEGKRPVHELYSGTS